LINQSSLGESLAVVTMLSFAIPQCSMREYFPRKRNTVMSIGKDSKMVLEEGDQTTDPFSP
ncbi:hypothetical protein BGZ80_003788, partial [Entomortierella chlamydospora]